MTLWHALVPFRQGEGGKSRLASRLSIEDRAGMALDMAQHVMAELGKVPELATLSLLAPEQPSWWSGLWARDEGAGLNPEIARWRNGLGHEPMLVVHADLPLLRADEVSALLACAGANGMAMATDRAGEGTNALAIADGRDFTFRFGPGSRALHVAQVAGMPVLSDVGLMTDIDTPDDLAWLDAMRKVTHTPG